MPKDNKFFEDMVKLAGSAMDTAFNSAAEMRKYLDDLVNEKLHALLQKQNLVTREEFEVVKEMAEKARLENEKLVKKIAALEKKSK
jgi:BMFP domain-containing protein YqiC